jgi:threonine/homoserine/homoserine lactone efflux protein
MFTFDTLLTFSIASFLLCLAPGPDNIFVLTQSIAYGKKSGIAVTLGLSTGLIFHTTAVTLGVAAIIMASSVAFTLLKTIGALYLLYLAYITFKDKGSKINNSNVKQLTFFQLYKRGIIMNITNPKVSIFFLAFLPQFTNPNNGSIAIQMIVLGMIFIFFTLLVFNFVAIVAGSIGDWLKKSEKTQIIMNKITSFIFAGLALKLFLTQRN